MCNGTPIIAKYHMLANATNWLLVQASTPAIIQRPTCGNFAITGGLSAPEYRYLHDQPEDSWENQDKLQVYCIARHCN